MTGIAIALGFLAGLTGILMGAGLLVAGIAIGRASRPRRDPLPRAQPVIPDGPNPLDMSTWGPNPDDARVVALR